MARCPDDSEGRRLLDIENISGNCYFTYDGTSGYTTESAPVPGPDPTPGTVTVYFKNTQGWSSVNCYAYIEGGSNNGEWPGAAMTYDADITVNGSKGWWKYTLPTGLENASVISRCHGVRPGSRRFIYGLRRYRLEYSHGRR